MSNLVTALATVFLRLQPFKYKILGKGVFYAEFSYCSGYG